MAKATKFTDAPHARIYTDWVNLPAWRTLSPIAKVGLVEVLARYRPETNALVRFSVRDLATLLGCSKSTAGALLGQLEDRGWIAPLERGQLRKRPPTTYRLTMYPDPICGEPPSREFSVWEPLLRSDRRGR